jgi:hypothetical protein
MYVMMDMIESNPLPRVVEPNFIALIASIITNSMLHDDNEVITPREATGHAVVTQLCNM